MDLTYSQADEAFRAEVRIWLAVNLPPRDKSVSNLPMDAPQRLRQAKAWQRKLYEAGYVAMSWPKEYGGIGFTWEHDMHFWLNAPSGMRSLLAIPLTTANVSCTSKTPEQLNPEP